MHSGPPLVVCRGIAEQRELPAGGARSAVGGILGVRNNPWLNGTAPGLCIGLTGGNTDVQLNDLVPILPCTHEDAVCGRGCVKSDPAKQAKRRRKMVRQLQSTQSRRNGYIGGYIGKRQKVGGLEAKKCIDKMYTLRDRVQGKSQFQKQRAVSGRMVTDIEMNGTMRGAVEEHNLCINLRKNDVLFAECIRTFPTVHVNAQQWLHRLEVELDHAQAFTSTVMVPPTRKPNARSIHSKAPWVDLYGFRPLVPPFKFLSPFEFLRHFQGEALGPPTGTQLRSKWTPEGQRLNSINSFADGKMKIVPGIHYVVVEPNADDTYFTFPTSPRSIYDLLRNCWILTRRARPHVPVLEGAKLPSQTAGDEYNAKYMSVFFRPWTLRGDEPGVPPLHSLGGSNSPAPEAKTGTCGAHHSFHKEWERYVHGNVVSVAASNLIRSVLTKTLASKGEGEDEGSQGDASDADEEIPPLNVRPEDLRQLLRSACDDSDDGDEPAAKKRRARQKTSHRDSLHRVDCLWGSTADGRSDEKASTGQDTMHFDAVQEHIAASRQKQEADMDDRPYSGKTLPAAQLYDAAKVSSLDPWLEELQASTQPPTVEQATFLRAVLERLSREASSEGHGNTSDQDSEPLFDMVHGVPGAGKSKLIEWLRRAFEEVLGWTHGVQFVCIAFQNTMAAHIGGYTIHHWSGIPVAEEAGMSSTRDAHKFSTRCQSLRFILVDEISMVSAQLLGQLELLVSKVVRRRSLFKRRPDGTHRPFGGINVLLFGDWWQLKPVSGTALFADPATAGSSTAWHGLQLLWGAPPNAVHRCWDFTTSLRCDDPWYNDVLAQCRQGDLQPSCYQALNGFPTSAPMLKTSSNTGPANCACVGSCDKDGYFIPWVRAFLDDGKAGTELVSSECTACHEVRSSRSRVLDMQSLPTALLDKPPFDSAPALYAYNVPRYYALLQRARGRLSVGMRSRA